MVNTRSSSNPKGKARAVSPRKSNARTSAARASADRAALRRQVERERALVGLAAIDENGRPYRDSSKTDSVSKDIADGTRVETQIHTTRTYLDNDMGASISPLRIW